LTKPAPRNLSASIRQKLANLARERNVDFGLILVKYGLERMSQMAISGEGPFLFPSNPNPSGHQTALKTVWQKTLRRAKIPYFRIYDIRSTYATRLSAGGVADEWVTQMLRQSDAQVFKKNSQMKLQMKREALVKLNRRANEMAQVAADTLTAGPMCIVTVQ
jgi:integrase